MSCSKPPTDDHLLDLLKQRYVDGGLSLSEFEDAVGYYLETDRMPADALGVYIPQDVQAREIGTDT